MSNGHLFPLTGDNLIVAVAGAIVLRALETASFSPFCLAALRSSCGLPCPGFVSSSVEPRTHRVFGFLNNII